ncbi:MAG TPA: CsbD family protein [Terriglobales bacterium]|nr:CsbD family protein [Terriglobales bacterium]
MDKDRIEGKGKDIVGRLKRQTGEWTDNEEQQAGGTAQQAEGKVQGVAGKVKDTGRDAVGNIQQRRGTEKEQGMQDESSEEEKRPGGKRAA